MPGKTKITSWEALVEALPGQIGHDCTDLQCPCAAARAKRRAFGRADIGIEDIRDPSMLWHYREALRFVVGEYRPLDDDLLTVRPNPDHYLHRSTERPDMVAYTPDERYGKEDRQVRTRIGRYLRQFHGELGESAIADIAARVRCRYERPMLQWARSRDEIRDVYVHGPQSCMSHGGVRGEPCGHSDCPDGDCVHPYRSAPIHPAEAYASEDVGIAYTEREGRITARAVCNMRERRYWRVYGDTGALEAALDTEGFERHLCALAGCRLLAIEAPEGRGYITPYLDGDVTDAELSSDGRWLVLGHGPFSLTHADGLTGAPSIGACEDCDDSIYEEDDCENVGGTLVCRSCIERNYTLAYVSRWDLEWMHDSEREVTIWEYHGEWYHEDALEAHGLTLDADGDVILEEDAIEDEEGDIRSRNECAEVECDDGTTLYYYDETSSEIVYDDERGCWRLVDEYEVEQREREGEEPSAARPIRDPLTIDAFGAGD